jgi:hypothetical protein
VKEQEGDGELLSFAAFELLRGVFNKELDSHARNIVGGTSTGAGPRILLLSCSVRTSDPSLIYLLGPYTLSQSLRGVAFQLSSKCLLFCFRARKTVLSHSQHRTFSIFGSVKLQGSEDPIQKPVPYAARLYTNRQEKKLNRTLGLSAVHWKMQSRPKEMLAAQSRWTGASDYIRTPLCTLTLSVALLASLNRSRFPSIALPQCLAGTSARVARMACMCP